MEITKISFAFNKIAGLAGEKHWRDCGMQDKEVHLYGVWRETAWVF